MLTILKESWKTLFGNKITRSSPRKNSRLQLQILEDRTVPATWIYQGSGTGNWNDYYNWDTQAVPTALDDVIFTGNTGSCNATGVGSTIARSITLTETYSSTLNIVRPTGIGEGGLHLAGGAISQALGMASQLSVRGNSTITGGILNSSAVHSFVSFLYCNVSLVGNLPKETGSTIKLASAVMKNLGDGFTTFSKGAGIEIDDKSLLSIEGAGGFLGTGTTVGIIANKGGKINKINQHAVLSNLPLEQTLGSAETKIANGSITFALTNLPSGYRVEIKGGLLELTGGTLLDVSVGESFGLRIDSGATLATKLQATAVISGDLFLGAAVVNLNGVDGVGRLSVDGNVSMTSATLYECTIDATANTSDRIICGKEFSIDGTLSVTEINVPATGIPAGMRWEIMTYASKVLDFHSFLRPNGLTTWFDGTRYEVRS